MRVSILSLARKTVNLTKLFPDRVIVYGRAGEILQVVSNILVNSIQALPPQDAEIRMRIRQLEIMFT